MSETPDNLPRMAGTPPQPQPPERDENPDRDASGSSWAKTVEAYRWPLAFAFLALIGLLVAYDLIGTGRDAVNALPNAMNNITHGVARIAERLNTRNITRTFVESLPELASPEGGNLEVATIRVVETITESDSLFGREDSSLWTTTSEIRLPVTYRYHIRLNDDWRLETDEQTCLVYAPAIRPSLPPAIHTDGMSKRTESGWLRFNATKQMRELEEGLTPALSRFAADEKHLAMVRNEARQVVADFIRNWLLREEHWSEDRFRAIIVVFDGEEDPAYRPGPTISIDDRSGP